MPNKTRETYTVQPPHTTKICVVCGCEIDTSLGCIQEPKMCQKCYKDKIPRMLNEAKYQVIIAEGKIEHIDKLINNLTTAHIVKITSESENIVIKYTTFKSKEISAFLKAAKAVKKLRQTRLKEMQQEVEYWEAERARRTSI